MGNLQLTKVEALELICPVVDGEATDEEVEAFEKYINKDPEVRDKYRSMKQMKDVVSNRCPRATSPDSLVHFLKNVGEKSSQQADEPGSKLNENDPSKDTTITSSLKDTLSNKKEYLYAAAASLLIMAAAWSFFNFSSVNATQQPTYVDNQVFSYFNRTEGQLIDPTIPTSDINTAETELENRYEINVKVPFLKGASFEGVVHSEFIEGFKTPMLEYSLSDNRGTIYIFAFKMSELSEQNRLLLFPEAVKSIIRSQDYYIRKLQGKEMIHWKWNDVWYTGISHLDGNSLATRIDGLKNNVTRM